MKLYISTEIPEDVINSIATADIAQFGMHTDTGVSVDQVISSLKERVLNGTLVLGYYKGCSYFLTDFLPGVVHLDSIRGNGATIFNYVSGIKKLLELIKDTTKLHKVVTKTPNKDLMKLQKKTGFELEGTHKEEYLMPDGSYSDVYSFGYILRRD
jgi:hypothetical protein